MNITNLFLANFITEGVISQGSSIFPDKNNVSKENYIPTVGMFPRECFLIYLKAILIEF